MTVATAAPVSYTHLLQDHIQHCIVDAVKDGDMEALEELNKAIDRFMK